MIIDGRMIQRKILDSIREDGAGAHIRVITVAPTPATVSYLSIKRKAAESVGMTLEVVELPDSASNDEVIRALLGEADAVIVQLPLPASINTDEVLAAIPPQKDADALSPHTREWGGVVAPVAAAVEEMLKECGLDVPGARAVVVGKGRLVGRPVAEHLAALGASVSSYDEHSFTPEALGGAEIVVAGAGVPSLITPGMVTPDMVLIDAGTSEQSGVLVGDIDPACAGIVRAYTPVPGGVGPVTVACLLRNVAQLRKGNIQVL